MGRKNKNQSAVEQVTATSTARASLAAARALLEQPTVPVCGKNGDSTGLEKGAREALVGVLRARARQLGSNASAGNGDGFDVPQVAIPGLLGLPMGRVVSWRDGNLAEGADWARAGHGEVFWSRGALEAFGATLGLLPQDLTVPAGGTAEMAPRFRTVRMLRAWAPTRNERILMAHFEEKTPVTARDLVRVWVKDCRAFRRGQPVPARWKDADQWVHDRTLLRELESKKGQP